MSSPTVIKGCTQQAVLNLQKKNRLTFQVSEGFLSTTVRLKNINLAVIALSVHSRLILWLIPLISWNGKVPMGSLFNIYKK